MKILLKNKLNICKPEMFNMSKFPVSNQDIIILNNN